jgi:polysaccharide export outer membrane protein
MHNYAKLFLASLVLVGCDEVVLRQPDLSQPDAEVEVQPEPYEVTAIDLTPEVVSRANKTPFRQLVVVGGDESGPARLVEPDDAIRRIPPPADREFDYVLGTGDVLRLGRLSYVVGPDGIEREEMITRDLAISEAGYVELADGRQVQVGGLTVEEARQVIATALIDTSDRLASEVVERPLPKMPAPEYKVGVGDVLGISRLVRVSEAGEFTERLVTRPAKVDPNGTITVLDIGAIGVAGLTTAQLQDTISQEALRAGLSTEILVDVQEFNSQSALVTGELGTQLVPITSDPLTIDRLLVSVNPNLSRERDYLVRIERGQDNYQMRAREILLEGQRDQYPVLDGDRIVIERLEQLPSFQLSISDFRSSTVTIAGVRKGDPEGGGARSSDVSEIVLNNQGLDLRGLLTQFNFAADRDRDALIRLIRDGREYRLSTREVLLDAPGTRYWLKPGDHVIVEELAYSRSTALVMGTVGQPQRLGLSSVERTTLSEALFSGPSQPTPDADFGHIYVLRGDGRIFTAYHLDLRDVVRAGLAERFELRPGDIVFVRKRPISKFNESLRLALGLASGVSGLQSVAQEVSGGGASET